MNSILKFLVPVCCIALSSAVEVEIPVVPALKFDVPLTTAQVESCPTYIDSFKTQYTTSTACVPATLATAQWSNFKLGFSAVKGEDGIAARDFGTSYENCQTKEGGDDDKVALQKKYCDYINNAATQCRCDTTTCIAGDLVGKIATDKKIACDGVPTLMCEATQTAMNTPCQAAVSAAVALPIPPTSPYDKTKITLKCAKEDCPKNTIEMEVPLTPVLKFKVPLTLAEATSCDAEIVSFKTQYTTSAKCVTTAVATTQWNNFKLGFSAVTPTKDFGTSHTTCLAVAPSDTTHKAYCDYIKKVVDQCRCDTTTCIAGDLVDKVTTDKKTACYGVPTTMCESTQTAMKTPCDAALTATLPDGKAYDQTKIALKCATGDCPKKPQADTTTAAPPKASGALGLAAMVALVTMITTMIIA